jgi:alpha-glucosidase
VGLCGPIFGGADVPYFMGDYSEEQVILGYQLGVFMPFMRAHNIVKNNSTGEPWIFTPSVSEFIHQSLDLRYELFHYLYT